MIDYLESQGQYAGLIDGVNVSLTDKYKLYMKAYLEVEMVLKSVIYIYMCVCACHEVSHFLLQHKYFILFYYRNNTCQ